MSGSPPKNITKKRRITIKGSPVIISTATITRKNQPGRYNEKFIEIFDELATIMMKTGEPFKSRAYQKAVETIMTLSMDITSADQIAGLEKLPGIGDAIVKKMKEIIETGTLRLLEKEKANPVYVLTDVYGIGGKKAQELIGKGITDICNLRERQDEVLNGTQRIGLKYYEDVLKRIPRKEIDDYKKVFQSVFSDTGFVDSSFEIVGSYRRGATSSGDIDVIFTSPNLGLFHTFLDALVKRGIILYVLSRGNSKCLVMAKLPSSDVVRRVDFLYTTVEQYPFAVLYFTGSKTFNTVMRGKAVSMGYSLNEHGLTTRSGEKVGQEFTSERDIFDFLGMEWREPHDRIDGRSVIQKIGIDRVSEKLLPSEKLTEKEFIKAMKKEERLLEKEAKKEEKTRKKQEKLDQKIKNLSVKKTRLEKQNKPIPILLSIHTENMEPILDAIKTFQTSGISILDTYDKSLLENMLRHANSSYYNITTNESNSNKETAMTDGEYDVLKEYVERKYPKSEALEEIGAPIIGKNKVTLPYEMASMDKIKPDTGAIDNWKHKYKGPYVVSCKLDGVSGMYCLSADGSRKLYTRGNGKVGQDVSHLIEHLKLPQSIPSGLSAAVKKDLVIRGEFILAKDIFAKKYSVTFANARNLVSGMVNRLSADEKIADLHFVAYEVIEPPMLPSEQMAMLATLNVSVVENSLVDNVTNELLSAKLLDKRQNYTYEIDGVIVTNDAIYPRSSGNPDHSFAFKMVLSDQMAEAKVVDVTWSPSKDGYLKPRVQIEPIQLGGVTIEFATGFNAAFIEQNKIGVGAVIEIIRSGDVIPHIKRVISGASITKMPTIAYTWNSTHIDILMENASSDMTVRIKNITGFFKRLEVVGLGEGNVSKIVEAGFDTVPKILRMTMADFKSIPGFQAKMADKLVGGIKERVNAASLVTIMAASNLMGRGNGERKISVIFETYPDILTSPLQPEEKVRLVQGLEGFAEKSAKLFVDNISGFLVFLRECQLESKLSVKLENKVVSTIVDNSNHPLYKQSVVMTGTRDQTAISLLKSVDGKVAGSVTKNTKVVVASDPNENTGKIQDAKRLGIPIMLPIEFISLYFQTMPSGL
jgi:NAD-dependent DNA ligase/DNA polymerase/3'-5' exonuclease PolX